MAWVPFANEIASTQKTVDALTASGVNKIVILSHIGTERDVLLAAGTTGIYVIVGGHSHSLLGDFTFFQVNGFASFAGQTKR